MQITIHSTERIVEVNGIQCRQWEGKTERGVDVVVLVPRIAVRRDHDISQFERELTEQPPMTAAGLGRKKSERPKDDLEFRISQSGRRAAELGDRISEILNGHTLDESSRAVMLVLIGCLDQMEDSTGRFTPQGLLSLNELLQEQVALMEFATEDREN